MIALLDTHVLRWWLDDPKRVSPPARFAIGNKSNGMMISAAVPWELAIKTNIGKLKAESFLARWSEIMQVQGFGELTINSADAMRAGLLPLHHKDPFDRLLVAQAQATGWPIISADPVFDHYGVRRIW